MIVPVFLVAGILASPSSAGASAACSWSVSPTPNPDGLASASLNGIVAFSPTDLWVVGTLLQDSSLAEHWDGSAWTVVPSPPSPAGDHFYGVVATGGAVWAVGAAGCTGGCSQNAEIARTDPKDRNHGKPMEEGDLIAASRSVDEVREFIGATSLAYLSLDGLTQSTGRPGTELCRACLTREPAVLERLAGESKPPKVAIGVEVEEAFLHCAKAFKRSALWRPEEWPETERLARAAQIWRDHMALDMTTQDVQDFVDEDYSGNLSWT